MEFDAPVVVGETHFFRYPAQLEHLVQHALGPWLRNHPDQICFIWSAGCANGAEPYSLAIAAAQAYPAEMLAGRIQILATDVSAEALANAQEARYSEWYLRGCSQAVRQRFFSLRDDFWQLNPEVCQCVHFSLADLRMPQAVPPCHLIVCRNVLIYYQPEIVESILEQLVANLVPGGSLYLGFTEALQLHHPMMELTSREAAAFRKRQHLPASLLPAPVPSPAPLPSIAAPVEVSPLKHTENGRSWLEQANHWLESDQPERARDCLRRTLYLEPDMAVAHFRLGMLEWSQNRWRQARKCWQNALELSQAAPSEGPVPGWESCNWQRFQREIQTYLERVNAL